MFDIKQYKETLVHLDEANAEDTMELILVIYGVGAILMIAPAMYYVTEDPLIAGLIALTGVLDLAMSQYLPSRMNFEDDDNGADDAGVDSSKTDNSEADKDEDGLF